MLKNITSEKYNQYLADAAASSDDHFTFDGLEEYIEGLLLNYERELDALGKYVDDNINTKTALRKIRKYFDTDATPPQVNNTLLSGDIDVDSETMKDLFSIYVLVHKLKNRKLSLRRRITSLRTALSRFEKLNKKYA